MLQTRNSALIFNMHIYFCHGINYWNENITFLHNFYIYSHHRGHTFKSFPRPNVTWHW